MQPPIIHSAHNIQETSSRPSFLAQYTPTLSSPTNSQDILIPPTSSPPLSAMEPWVDDIADDLQSMSFNSSTTTTATDINRSTSSGSDWTSSSAYFPSTTTFKSHSSTAPSGDPCWDSIRRFPSLSLSDLRFLHRLGAGDIGSVYLAELKPQSSADPPKLPPPSAAEPPKRPPPSPKPAAVFAAKVMDRKELVSRNKEGRARTEKEILEMLDHPFLPTLYAAVDSPKWSCLLTEFCPGGDLHILRQRQPCKRFPESAVRCAF